MPNPSEIKLLRDELARAIADLKKRNRVIDEMVVNQKQPGIKCERLDIAYERVSIKNEHLITENEQLRIENERLRAKWHEDSRKMSYYENPQS